MGTISLTLPVIGQPNSTEDVKIPNALSAIQTFVNGQNVADTNVTPAGLTDASLASPNNVVWRPTPVLVPSFILAGTVAATYAVVTGGLSSGGTGTAPPLWYPQSADLAVAGKTTRFRVVVGYAVNATAPGVTFTWGLYPVTAVAGGASVVSYTLGTVVVGSTVLVVTPGASGGTRSVSSGFDMSALTNGTLYVPGVVVSATTNANSHVHFNFSLEMRHT